MVVIKSLLQEPCYLKKNSIPVTADVSIAGGSLSDIVDDKVDGVDVWHGNLFPIPFSHFQDIFGKELSLISF